MSPSVISLIGILLGMVILVFLAFKGYNVIIVSVIAALVVAITETIMTLSFLLSPHWLWPFLPAPTFCR